MDRTLKVYSKTDHLFAEFIFNYDHPRQATGRYILYRRIYNDDEEDESKAVYPLMEMEIYPRYQQFDTIEQIKTHDIGIVKEYVGREMQNPPETYRYVYPPDPVLQRYTAGNHVGFIGIIDVRFSFVENTKEMKFYSATNPRFDFELSSDSLETNISCIAKIPVYSGGESHEISTYDLKRLEVWY